MSLPKLSTKPAPTPASAIPAVARQTREAVAHVRTKPGTIGGVK